MKLQLAQDIVALHAAHLQTGTPPAWADCVRPEDDVHGEQAAAVLAACRSMGFVEEDAQLLARAWTAQALRLGQFDTTAWPDDPRDFGVHTGPRADAFALCPQQLGLYAVLPDAAWVARMAEAGVPTLQLRFKSDDRAAVAREVQAAVRAVQGSVSLLFINDHWREAIDAGAYGVHLGQEDLEGAREQLHSIRAAGLRLGQFDATAWPDDARDFGVHTGPRGDAFAPCPQQLGLYAVLPDAAWVARMAEAGVPTLQLRFKSDDRAAVAREVQAAVRAVQGSASLLFINDHWREAIDAGAYGVHLGQEDLEGAREQLHSIRSAGLRLGLSTHGYAELLRAESVGPSYLALGAVYATTLKRMATAPQGPGRLAAYARLMRHRPLVAIGGIDFARLDEVLPSGVGSIAVVRALVAAQDPAAEARRFMDRLATARKAP